MPTALLRWNAVVRERLVLVPVAAGALTLTHRPRRDSLVAWKQDGVTHVVTLLGERENARDVGEAAANAGLDWVWIPMPDATIPGDTRTRALLPAIDQVLAILAQGGHVVIHCSAGIHRTGMFGYAVLRRHGLSPDEARTYLAEMRAVTAEGVGRARLAWGDSVAGLVP